MDFFKRMSRHNFFIRLKSWEYWPFWVVQLPLVLYWLWLSLRARSLLFFSGSNPSIVLGGMLGESKFSILKRVPDHLIPKTIFIEMPITLNDVMKAIDKNNLQFPLVFKPDIGERGFMVKRIYSIEDAEFYLRDVKVNFLVQELIDLPIESGVFYTRFPDEPDGKVTSLVFKEMLSVAGDGESTVQQLIFKKERAKLQWETLKATHRPILTNVIPAGQTLELNPIGNHCLGTKFLDGNQQITDELSRTFDSISKQIDGFYFGRIDLKCASLEDLTTGNVKIMEVNGCGAEPSHIYQPGFSLWKAYEVLFMHWKNIFIISNQTKKRGFVYPTFREGVTIYQKFKTKMKTTQ